MGTVPAGRVDATPFELIELSALSVSPRSRELNERQLALKKELLVAGLEVVVEVGYSNLTLRNVAGRAGTTHATAYHYFASKAHLVAELFYSFLLAVPVEEPDPSVPLAQRIGRALGRTAAKFGEVEALAQAGNSALAQEEPDVVMLRGAIGADLVRRIVIASGDDVDAELTEQAMLTYMGAMLWAAAGALEYADVGRRIERVARYFGAARSAGITDKPYSTGNPPRPPIQPTASAAGET
jgi:AcrR family transcriptional regulator